MIQICPAILTFDINEFEKELKSYSEYFDQIDIDFNIAGDDFAGQVLVNPSDAFPILKKLVPDLNVKLGLHLMVSKPLQIIQQWDEEVEYKNVIFYVHQESNIHAVLASNYADKYEIGLSVKVESGAKEMDYYNIFPEIQLMTVSTGNQGNPFHKEVLNRVGWLKANGYKGKISIDGGVNLRTAEFIRNFELDRVSVGSYFSKSADIKTDLARLTLALNM